MSETEKIHRYVIKSAPYGQLSEVLKDLQKVSQLDLSSEHITEAIQKFNEEHLAIFGDKLISMKPNRVGTNKYFDQLKKKVYTIDPVTHEVLDSQEKDHQLPEPVVELLESLNKELTKYVKKYFREPHGHSVFVEVDAEAGVIVHLGFTGKNVNLGNFYTGEWISQWTITKELIKGETTARAHFFEAGNVQLHQKKGLEQGFNFEHDLAESAKKIIKAIESFECEVQEGLSKVYEEMPSNFFKNLRRLTPYTKTKMAWNINAIKMNQNLLSMNK